MSFGVLFATFAVVAIMRALFGKQEKGSSATAALDAVPLLVLILTTFLAGLFAIFTHAWLAVLITGVCALLWLGAFVGHGVFAPLGMPRCAYFFAYHGATTFRRDARAHACLAAARACVAIRGKQGVVAEKHFAPIDKHLARCTLTGAAVATLGFIAITRGERSRGRDLLASVSGLPRASRPARDFATRWLVADAARRGDWASLLVLGETFTTPLTRFAHAVAARFLHASPTNRQLWGLWFRCPARIATYPLLQRALAYQPAEAAHADAPLLARHIALVRNGGTDNALIALAEAWESADVPFEARETIAADLASLGVARPHLAEKHPAFIPPASHDDAQGELEIAADALKRRHEDKRDLPVLDEWSEYVMLRELYRRASVTLAGRHLAYDTAHLAIGNHAVYLFNNRGERQMGHAVFLWLLAESMAVNDEGFIAHYSRNASVTR